MRFSTMTLHEKVTGADRTISQSQDSVTLIVGIRQLEVLQPYAIPDSPTLLLVHASVGESLKYFSQSTYLGNQ